MEFIELSVVLGASLSASKVCEDTKAQMVFSPV